MAVHRKKEEIQERKRERERVEVVLEGNKSQTGRQTQQSIRKLSSLMQCIKKGLSSMDSSMDMEYMNLSPKGQDQEFPSGS